MELYTIGYGNREFATIVNILKLNGIKQVYDVRRKNTGARLRCFLPSQLCNELPTQYNIGYTDEHRLGNKFTNYPLQESLKKYKDWLGSNEGDAIIEDIEFNIRQETGVVFLCAEKDAAKCHRKIVAEEVARRLGYTVVHL